MDLSAYKAFKKLKEKYSPRMIKVTEQDLLSITARDSGDHREYVRRRFEREGIVVTRFAHVYDSLQGENPQLGLVHLASDSVLEPGFEVWALIGHNAEYKDLQ